MDRRCRTGEVVDPVHFHLERIDHIMPHHFEILIIQQMGDIFTATGKEIVQADDFLALLDKAFTQMTSEKTGSSCN
jgi:hypothetical protein